MRLMLLANVCEGQRDHHDRHHISLRKGRQVFAACTFQGVITQREWLLCHADLWVSGPPSAALRPSGPLQAASQTRDQHTDEEEEDP
jgi:hypothetical protein